MATGAVARRKLPRSIYAAVLLAAALTALLTAWFFAGWAGVRARQREVEAAPKLAADPSVVMATIVSANTALNVRMAEARFGRAMTDRDFETLTLASAFIAQKHTATDYVAAQLSAFQISRALATFFENCDVLLCPTLCSPPLRIGELNTMAQDLSDIGPTLRRYMPATAMFNMSGQPAMSVPLAWNRAGLPLGMMFSARFGDEATLLRLAAQLEQERPWKTKLPPICA